MTTNETLAPALDCAAPHSGTSSKAEALLASLKCRTSHPQIDVEFYAWYRNLSEYDRRFVQTAASNAILMFGWQRSRTTLNDPQFLANTNKARLDDLKHAVQVETAKWLETREDVVEMQEEIKALEAELAKPDYENP